MYMSRIALDPFRRETMQALARPRLFHGAVETAFDGEPDRRLWRIDHLNNQCYLLLVSQQKPNLLHVKQQFGYSQDPELWETRDYTPFLNRLKEGQAWQFRLCANPVKSTTVPNERGKVSALVTIGQQREWLLRQAETHGFTLEEGGFDIVHTAWIRFQKASGHTVTLRTAVFEGRLIIKDAPALSEALTTGIGRAKAYGCGMMTLAGMTNP